MANDIVQDFTSLENVIAKPDQLSYLEEVLERIKKQENQDADIVPNQDDKNLSEEANFEIETEPVQITNDINREALQEREEEVRADLLQAEAAEAEAEVTADYMPIANTEDEPAEAEESTSTEVDTLQSSPLKPIQASMYVKPNKFLIISWIKT